MNLSSIAFAYFLSLSSSSSSAIAEAALKGTHAACCFRRKWIWGGKTTEEKHRWLSQGRIPLRHEYNGTIVKWPNGIYVNRTVAPFKLTFPQENYTDFKLANFNGAQGTPRFPAGIFYAESKEEVVKAVECANKAGYKISPRGRGHSYQGLSSMDGYLVIDMSLMCKPEEFVVNDEPSPWLLGGGQKAIGSIKSGAGCTNAVMLAFTAAAFPDGIYLIGSCPTVGITGYATGGGQGDTTPWVGLGIDDVLSYDIVLYDGSFVTASATSHPDLYWALRGGGSGFGVITSTSLETAVISPPEESSGGFTYVNFRYKQTQNEARKFFERFQDFLVPDLPFGSKKYKEEIRETSARFGGGATYFTDSSKGLLSVYGLFLGSEDETNSVFEEAGLLDQDILNASVTLEFSSYAEAQLFIICETMYSNPWYSATWTYPSLYENGTYSSTDVCEDLGIDSVQYCHEVHVYDYGEYGGKFWPMRVPNCNIHHYENSFNLTDVKDTILPALKEVASEPQSWFNRPGAKRVAEAEQIVYSEVASKTWPGGLLHGRLDPDVLLDLANVGVSVFHFAHGAPTVVERDETGYYNREEYSLLSLDNTTHYEAIASILVKKVYDGDASKLKGFYNYLNPEGNRDWRNYYFGENYEQLSVIKAKYDVTNGFGNPLQVEPAPSSSKAGKEPIFD